MAYEKRYHGVYPNSFATDTSVEPTPPPKMNTNLSSLFAEPRSPYADFPSYKPRALDYVPAALQLLNFAVNRKQIRKNAKDERREAGRVVEAGFQQRGISSSPGVAQAKARETTAVTSRMHDRLMDESSKLAPQIISSAIQPLVRKQQAEDLDRQWQAHRATVDASKSTLEKIDAAIVKGGLNPADLAQLLEYKKTLSQKYIPKEELDLMVSQAEENRARAESLRNPAPKEMSPAEKDREELNKIWNRHTAISRGEKAEPLTEAERQRIGLTPKVDNAAEDSLNRKIAYYKAILPNLVKGSPEQLQTVTELAKLSGIEVPPAGTNPAWYESAWKYFTTPEFSLPTSAAQPTPTPVSAPSTAPTQSPQGTYANDSEEELLRKIKEGK